MCGVGTVKPESWSSVKVTWQGPPPDDPRARPCSVASWVNDPFCTPRPHPDSMQCAVLLRLLESTRMLPSWHLWPATYHSMRQFVRVADVPSRHRLRSSTSDDLIVPAVRLTSIGSPAFPVAGARIWNTYHCTSPLPYPLTVFKQHLKLHLFCFSFPGLTPVWLLIGPCSDCWLFPLRPL